MSNEVFLYSEETENGTTNEVSAETLNQIAVDLGCVEFAEGDNAFVEGTEYTIDALNRITSSLVTAGILLIGERCAVSWDSTNNKILIKDGVCVFSSGAKLRIESGKVLTLDLVEGGTNYVYALHNPNTNTISIVASLTEADAASDYVPLAQIDENRNVTDRRQYAKTNCIIKSDACIETVVVEKFHFCGAGLEKIIPCNSGANIVCMMYEVYDSWYGYPDNTTYIRHGVKITDDNGEPLQNGVTISLYYLTGGAYNAYKGRFMNFKKVDEGLKITYWRGGYEGPAGGSYHYDCSGDDDCWYTTETDILKLRIL